MPRLLQAPLSHPTNHARPPPAPPITCKVVPLNQSAHHERQDQVYVLALGDISAIGVLLLTGRFEWWLGGRAGRWCRTWELNRHMCKFLKPWGLSVHKCIAAIVWNNLGASAPWSKAANTSRHQLVRHVARQVHSKPCCGASIHPPPTAPCPPFRSMQRRVNLSSAYQSGDLVAVGYNRRLHIMQDHGCKLLSSPRLRCVVLACDVCRRGAQRRGARGWKNRGFARMIVLQCTCLTYSLHLRAAPPRCHRDAPPGVELGPAGH